MTKKVAVALSGGVDSAVTATLLLEQGYDVVGITGKMTCDDDSVINNAKKVADKLGIQHYAYDATEEFNKNVVKYFENSYKTGATPNPCIMCNKYVKWGGLLNYCLNTLKADFIATGHYANIKFVDGYYKLYPATDTTKDQLYFLFLLDQEKLSKTIFPLAAYQKEEVKKLAEKYDLPPKSAKESQDICFIKPPLTTKKYLQNVIPESEGTFIEKRSGKIMGKHSGFWQYTIGQRKGIGIAAPEALYVLDTDSEKNIVYVGYKNELYSDKLILRNINWSYPQSEREFDALVKIRYNMKAVKAHVSCLDKMVLIEFSEPVSALAAGQACVLYNINDGHLLGGGIITRQ